ncbi:unnamed protein product [Boreogadus saida]
MEEPRLGRTTSLHQQGSSDKLLLSGGLTEKPYIWKANPEDDQDSTSRIPRLCLRRADGELRRWRTTRNRPKRIPQRVSGAEASW